MPTGREVYMMDSHGFGRRPVTGMVLLLRSSWILMDTPAGLLDGQGDGLTRIIKLQSCAITELDLTSSGLT